MLKFSGVCVVFVLYQYAPYQNFAQDVATEESVTINENLVHLNLYIKSKKPTPELTLKLNDTNLSETPFNSSQPVIIILHGFQSTYDDFLLQYLKNAFVQKTGWNVIMVDWGPLSKIKLYPQAVRNAYSVSLLVGRWLTKIISRGYTSPGQVQIAGHSIGAHMAGIISKHTVPGKVAKIFALDPALPIFEKKPDSERLHKSDAEFVEVIHTCGQHISYDFSLGRVDFYPNGGVLQYENCMRPLPGNSEPWGTKMIKMIICSHMIVLQYFAESVIEENKFMAVKCDSWHQFKNKNCSNEQVIMGLATPTNITGDYYLNLTLESSKLMLEGMQHRFS